MRGDAPNQLSETPDLESTYEAARLDVLVSEIEDAGFELDVQEGFEEEWEEEFWVDTDADELDVLALDAEDAEALDPGEEELLSPEEIVEGWDEADWEDPDVLLEEPVDAYGLYDELISDEWEMFLNQEDVALAKEIREDEDWEAEVEWWEEDETPLDDSWNEIMETWEMEELEDEYEMEDLDLLEAMYEAS